MKKLILGEGNEPTEVDMTEEEVAELAAAFTPLPLPSVTRRQLRLWLLAHGKTSADVAAAIEAIQDPVARAQAMIEWEDSTEYERSHPLIAQLAPGFGLATPEAIDAAFLEAASI